MEYLQNESSWEGWVLEGNFFGENLGEANNVGHIIKKIDDYESGMEKNLKIIGCINV